MLKRAFDIVISAVALVVLSPVLLAIAVIIRITSPGPVLYRATRVGRDGREFKLYKFRSMVVNADRHGPGITTAGDPRITPIGRVLRKSKLDEPPQLTNVCPRELSIAWPGP